MIRAMLPIVKSIQTTNRIYDDTAQANSAGDRRQSGRWSATGKATGGQRGYRPARLAEPGAGRGSGPGDWARRRANSDRRNGPRIDRSGRGAYRYRIWPA